MRFELSRNREQDNLFFFLFKTVLRSKGFVLVFQDCARCVISFKKMR